MSEAIQCYAMLCLMWCHLIAFTVTNEELTAVMRKVEDMDSAIRRDHHLPYHHISSQDMTSYDMTSHER